MLGAGIFVKTKSLNNLSHNNTAAIFVLMLLGVFIVISLMVPLSLIVSKQKTNLGFLEWTEKYCPSWFNNLAINFTRFIYQPLSLLLISTYIVEIIKNEYKLSTTVTICLSFLCVILFMVMNLLSFQFMAKVQLFLLVIVLISLFALPIIGFIDIANGKLVKTNIEYVPKKPTSLNGLGPWMILLSGFPSIFFMYDGFYNTLSFRDKMSRPEKLSLCLVIACILITLLYLFIIFSFKFGSSTGNYSDIPTVKNHPLLNGLFNMVVACSGFLTLNSSAMGNVRQLLAAHDEYEFKDVNFLKQKISLRKIVKNKRFFDELFTWFYLIVKTAIWYLFIGFVSQIVDFFSEQKENIFAINESIADVSSALIFLIIAVIIVNLTSIIQQKYSDRKTKIFKYLSIISASVIFISCAYTYLNYFVGMFGFNNANSFLCAFKLLVTLLFIFVSSLPLLIEKYTCFKNKDWYIFLGLNKQKNTHYTILKYKWK